jgi:hypothetical protein
LIGLSCRGSAPLSCLFWMEKGTAQVTGKRSACPTANGPRPLVCEFPVTLLRKPPLSPIFSPKK